MVVYQIARWSEVFETAESRKLKRMTWVAERTDFDSTGWQAGLDEFGPVQWPAIYGAWMVIVRLAANARTRGRLSGDKGEPWTATRIARPSGIAPEIVQQTLDWAIKIGWLVPVSITPGESAGNLPEHQEKNTPTGPDRTVQNITGPDRTRHADTEPSRPDCENESNRIRTFTELLRSIPELQKLADERIKPAGKRITGSVFDVQVERDLRASFDASADRRWAIVWYQQQLTAPKPVLTAASAAEAAIVLASVYAASRIRTEGGKVRSRWAIWSRWLRDRDASQVTDEDVRKAAGVVEELLQKRKETVA